MWQGMYRSHLLRVGSGFLQRRMQVESPAGMSGIEFFVQAGFVRKRRNDFFRYFLQRVGFAEEFVFRLGCFRRFVSRFIGRRIFYRIFHRIFFFGEFSVFLRGIIFCRTNGSLGCMREQP